MKKQTIFDSVKSLRKEIRELGEMQERKLNKNFGTEYFSGLFTRNLDRSDWGQHEV